MKRHFLISALTAVILFLMPNVNFGQAPNLGTASSFALFTSAGAFDNTGASSIIGNIGSFTYDPVGFPPGTVISGAIYGPLDGLSATAAPDVLAAYGDLSAVACVTTLVLPLAGQVLTPGVYCFGAPATLNGELTLDGQGNPDALFIIKIGGAFATVGGSNIKLINSASPNNVYWQIGGQFDLVDNCVFRGTVIVDGAIHLLGTSTLIGRGLSRAGAISTAANIVTLGAPPAAPTTSLTQPTCAVATGTITVTAPTGIGMTYSIDGSDYTNTTGIFSSLAPGTYNVTAMNSDGYVSARTSETVIASLGAPVAATATAIQPTCALATGTITVTAPLGAYQYNIDGGVYQASVTFAAVAAGSHNILVRRTADNTCISTATAVNIIAALGSPVAATATAIQPTCALATGTITVTAPLGAYQYNIDGGVYQASTTFTGVAAGSHNILVRRTSDNTCISTATAVNIIAALGSPLAATATALQPTCALATGTITVTAPLGAYQYNIDGGVYQASTTFTGVAAGSHNILVRRTADNTCISTATAVNIIAALGSPVAATATAIQPTCALATGTITVTAPLGAYQYNIDGGVYQASVTFAGVVAGSHNILVRRIADNTCISIATAVNIIAALGSPLAATATALQPTCALATGTITVTAPLGAYQYNIDGGVYQASTTFTGVAAGSHNILVRRTADNTCISTATAVNIIAALGSPLAATATALQPTCALATGTITVTAPLGAYQYNIDGGVYQASVTFAAVASGSHNILVRRTADNTCISTATAVNIIAALGSPLAATATALQPTCALATGTITVTAPLGAYQYNIDGGVYQASTTFTGVAAGSHNILVRRTADNTCISTATAVNIIAALGSPLAATATALQPTCALATGTITVTAPLGAYQYNIDGGVYQASTTFTGVAAGSHNILVRRTADNTCISTATAVNIIAAPGAPVAATATAIQPTCALATGTITVTAPLGAYQYNIDGGVYQASVTFAGVAAGSHNILVRRTADNTCISTATAVNIIAAPGAPVAATATAIQPTCALATGTITVTAPLGAYQYNIDGGVYQASVTFAAVAAGSHNILVRRTADNTCISTATAVNIIAAPGAPVAATATTLQPTCALATGTITVTAPLGAYQYNIDGGVYQASVTFAGVAAGSHNILVRRTADNTCISTATAVNIIAAPGAPVAATAIAIQPTCALATGTITVTAPLGAYQYNIDGGVYQASVTFAGVAASSHNILVRRTADNTCISTATAVNIIAAPGAPVAATATAIQPTCALATGTITVTAPLGAYQYNIDGGVYQASVTFAAVAAGSHNILVRRTADNTCISTATAVNIIAAPGAPVAATATTLQPTCALATGTITVTAPLGAYQYNIDGGVYQASVTFAGVAAGSHNILVRRTADNTCISTATAVNIIAAPGAPVAATAIAIQPTCALATGTITVTAPLGAYQYNIDGGVYQASVTFAGVAASSHNILVRRTADNTCISTATAVNITAAPGAPVAATATAIQPTCALATGTITVTAPLGAYQYNIDGGVYQASVTFAAVAAGSHNILVRRTADNTCISTATAVNIIAAPGAPVAATATAIQPTCALATGTITVTVPLGAYQYNIDGGVYQASVTFAGVAAGSHNILVRRTADNTCISTATAVNIIAALGSPVAATATAVQPTCALATGTITVTAPLGAYQYNIDGGVYQASVTFAGVAAGSHNILVRRTADNTCISTATAVNIIAALGSPVAATATAVQPTCALATGTITVTAPLGAYQYNIDGGVYQASVTFAGVAAGSHNILVRRTADNTCISTATVVIVNAQPLGPIASSITAGGPTTFCEGGSVVLSGNTGGTWSEGSLTAIITVNTSGDYFVTNTNSCGSVTSNHIIVTVNPLPVASVITAGGPTTFCEGGSVVLSGNTGGIWSEGSLTAIITVNTSGDYFVTNTNSCGSVTSNHIIVTVNPLPVASVITAGGPTTFCEGGSVVLSGNTGGTWSEGSLTAIITVNTSGDYFVTNTNICGSVTSNHIIVTVNPLPVASVITAGGPTTFCEGGSVILSGNIGGIWSDGSSAATLTVTTSGDYFVTNTNICGSVTSNHIIVTVNALPIASIITAGGQTTFCEGGSVVLSGNIGGTWSDGTSAATLTVTTSGDYFVTNTNICGSVTSNHIIVTVNPLPIASVITAGGPTTFCEGGSVVLSGNTGGTWSDGSLTASITVTISGDYFVTNTNICGSVTSNHIIVTVNPMPIASVITAGGPTIFCEGGSVVLSGNTGGTWSDGSLTASITVTISGDYFVTNTNVCGSVTSNHIIVTVNQIPDAIAAGNSPVCAGSVINLTAQTVQGGAYLWTGANGYSSSDQNPVILSATLLDAGDYILIVSANGCNSAPSVVTIMVNNCTADISVVKTVNNAYPFIGQTVVFTIIATNNGPSDATGVIVNDLLESGYTYVSSTVTTGIYDPSTGAWIIGILNNGASEILTISATVNSSGIYVNTATILGIEVDENKDNNISWTETFPRDFFIPEGFSPNGDGINDYFVIRGIDYYPGNTFVIFNRWGNKVFEASPYLNTWDGTCMFGLIVGKEELPIATYFYILDLGDGSDVYKGTIYLNR